PVVSAAAPFVFVDRRATQRLSAPTFAPPRCVVRGQNPFAKVRGRRADAAERRGDRYRSDTGRPLRVLREVDGLDLEVELEALDAAFAPDARLFEAAERHLRIDDHAVHGDAAGAHAASDHVAAFGVGRVDRTVQTVDRVVRLADRIVDVAVLDERDDGSEDLLLSDRHLSVDVGEHRRLDEIAALEALRPTAAGDELRAFLAAL